MVFPKWALKMTSSKNPSETLFTLATGKPVAP